MPFLIRNSSAIQKVNESYKETEINFIEPDPSTLSVNVCQNGVTGTDIIVLNCALFKSWVSIRVLLSGSKPFHLKAVPCGMVKIYPH